MLRERWAQLTNDALLAAGREERVDHRSYIDRGVNRDPVVSMPAKVVYSERKHGRSAAGDEIRARHRERVEARLKGKEELAGVVSKQKEEIRQRGILAFKEKEKVPRKTRYAALTRDEGFSYGGRNTTPTRTSLARDNVNSIVRTGTSDVRKRG